MKCLNSFVLVSIAVGPVLLAVFGYEAAGGLFLLALIIVMLVTNVSADRLEEFALGPLRAKLREKIREADDLSVQLKDALRLLLTMAVSSGMRAGRFAHEQGWLHQQIFEQVKTVGERAKLNQGELDTILTEFFKYVEVDMRRLIVGNRTFNDPRSEEIRKKIQDQKTDNGDRLRLMRELADREEYDPIELDDWLKDYSELIFFRRLRRPDLWWAHHERAYDDFVIKQKSRQLAE